MPTGLGHFIIGLAILIPIIYYTDGKFNNKVAAIFLINNWIGPDAGQAYKFLEDLTGIDFHWYLPFLILALPMALFFSYFSRFSLKKTERFFSIIDDGRREVNWKNAYLLCVSGGALHTIADAIFRHRTYDSTIKIFNHFIEPELGELYFIASYGTEVGILQAVPFIVMLLVIFFAVYILDHDWKQVLLIYAIIGAFTISFALIFGDKVIGEEYDVALTILSTAFILVPLLLLFYVEKDVNTNPTPMIEEPRIRAELGLKIIILISLTIGSILSVLGILVIVSPSLLDFLDISGALISLLSILVLSVGLIMIIGAFGLLFRINFARYLLMVVTSILFIFIFPLFIFYFLCQDNVKSLFS